MAGPTWSDILAGAAVVIVIVSMGYLLSLAHDNEEFVRHGAYKKAYLAFVNASSNTCDHDTVITSRNNFFDECNNLKDTRKKFSILSDHPTDNSSSLTNMNSITELSDALDTAKFKCATAMEIIFNCYSDADMRLTEYKSAIMNVVADWMNDVRLSPHI